MGKYIRGDVTLAGLHLKKLPEIFKDLTIEGNLFLNDNRLTTLENFPELASSEYIFPTEKTASRLNVFRSLTPDEESKWAEAFQQAQGN